MAAILGWTSGYITNQGEITGLDATTAFLTRNGSCTSYANLAAAAGRAAGVPTRTIANYLVGSAQQTHYIDEFYLDAQRGWRLVEPQKTALSLHSSYAILMHLDRIADEGNFSLDGLGGWAAGGVPARSLTHELEGGDRCDYRWPGPPRFPECPYCDNKAT